MVKENTERRYDIKKVKKYRERMVAAFKAKNWELETNYGLTIAHTKGPIFKLILKSKGLAYAAKITQINGIENFLKDEFGTRVLKPETEPVGNYEISNGRHWNEIMIDLRIAFDLEFPDDRAKYLAEAGVIEAEIVEESVKTNADATSTAIVRYSEHELNRAKEMPINPLTEEMLDAVISEDGMTLRQFLDEQCEIISSGTVCLYRTKNKSGVRATRFEENRRVREADVRALMQSYKEDGFLFRVMILSELLKIVDGQHGIEAALRSDLEFYFCIMPGWGIKEVQILNLNSQTWTMEDFLELYVYEKNPNYMRLHKFTVDHKKFDSLTTCYAIIANIKGGVTNTKAFKKGEYVATESQLVVAYQIAAQITELAQFHPKGWTTRNFVDAIIALRKENNYVHERLIQKLDSIPSLVLKKATSMAVIDYLELLVEKYNFHRSAAERIAIPTII